MLGLAGPVGGVVFAEGGELAVVGWFNAGELLAFLDGSLLEAADPDHPQPEVRAVHVLARRPEDVAVLTRAVLAVLGADDPGSVAVETSEARAAVAGELGRFGRRLVTVVLGVGLVLAGLTVYGSESSRRRDFGRRRALG
ncbi:MAG: FtsX-like permease family protein, partial [Acidimicrobiia bacterium]